MWVAVDKLKLEFDKLVGGKQVGVSMMEISSIDKNHGGTLGAITPRIPIKYAPVAGAVKYPSSN